MKKIEATIRKSKFREVKKALIDGGFNSFQYHLTRCISEKSEKRFYRGVEFQSKATERVALSIYVQDKHADTIVNIIKASGITGDANDSYLAVFHANQAYRIKGGTEEDQLIKIM